MLPWPLSCLCWVNALENRSFSGCCGHCCRWQKREYSAQCVVVFFNLHMALSGVEPTAAPPLFSMPWSSSRGSPPSALTIRAVVSNLPLPAPSIPAFQEWHSSHQHQGYCSSGSWPVMLSQHSRYTLSPPCARSSQSVPTGIGTTWCSLSVSGERQRTWRIVKVWVSVLMLMSVVTGGVVKVLNSSLEQCGGSKGTALTPSRGCFLCLALDLH